MIHVLTPIRKDEEVACDVTTQSVQCCQFTHSCDIENRRDNEAHNRNELKKHVSDPYTVLMDADVILGDKNTFKKMVDFLDKYEVFPAVAVDTKNRSDTNLARSTQVGHTVIALIMIRKPILDAIIFKHTYIDYSNRELLNETYLPRSRVNADSCLCCDVNFQIRTMTGVPIPYLKNVSATERK